MILNTSALLKVSVYSEHNPCTLYDDDKYWRTFKDYCEQCTLPPVHWLMILNTGAPLKVNVYSVHYTLYTF